MRNTKPSPQQVQQIKEVAEGWGKLLGELAFPEGPGLDVILGDLEDLIAEVTQAIVKGAVKSLTQQQALALGEEHEEHPYPGCEKPRRIHC